jgi:hypothetical protein
VTGLRFWRPNRLHQTKTQQEIPNNQQHGMGTRGYYNNTASPRIRSPGHLGTWNRGKTCLPRSRDDSRTTESPACQRPPAGPSELRNLESDITIPLFPCWPGPWGSEGPADKDSPCCPVPVATLIPCYHSFGTTFFPSVRSLSCWFRARTNWRTPQRSLRTPPGSGIGLEQISRKTFPSRVHGGVIVRKTGGGAAAA